MYVVTARRFASDADIIRDIHNDQQTRLNQLPFKILDPVDFKVKRSEEQLTDFNKAAILARKYRRDNYILNSLHRKRYLSDAQIALIFKIVKEIKAIKKDLDV